MLQPGDGMCSMLRASIADTFAVASLLPYFYR